MRAVFIGAGSLALMTTQLLLKRNHEVVIIEQEKSQIETLTVNMDCGFLHGDGSKPAILKEAGPSNTDILFCLTRGATSTPPATKLRWRSARFQNSLMRRAASGAGRSPRTARRRRN